MKVEAVLSHLLAVNAVFIENRAVFCVVAVVNVRVPMVALLFDTLMAFALGEFIGKTFHAAPFTLNSFVDHCHPNHVSIPSAIRSSAIT